MKKDTRLKQAFLLFIIFCGATFAQGSQKFRVILDAGHGGKDFGAVYNGYVEKNLVLNVVLKAGKLLEADNGIEVIYTRKSDSFIDLAERINTANKNSGDIFVTIHCNAESKKVAFGAETYVLGTTKNASNIELSKKENAVLQVEKDFKTRYEDYNSTTPEVIQGAFSAQENVVTKSIDLASKVQEGFIGLKRKNRGVKQGPLYILNKVAMPGVFVELGFISNPEEGEYLASEAGQQEMAKAIANAITSYKKENYTAGSTNTAAQSAAAMPVSSGAATTTTSTATTAVTPKPAATTVPASATTTASAGVVFKVQIAASGKDLELVPSNFNGLGSISKDASSAVIKYFYGSANDYAGAKQLLAEAKGKGYTSAFVVAFKNGKKIALQDALK